MLSEPLHQHELRTPDLKPKKKKTHHSGPDQWSVSGWWTAGCPSFPRCRVCRHRRRCHSWACLRTWIQWFSFALNEKFGSFLLQRSVSSEERNFFLSSRRLSFGVHFNKFFFSLFRGYFPRFFMYISVPLFVPRRVECVLLLLLLVSLSLSFLARLFCSHPSTMGRLKERERITTRKPYHVNG